MSLDNLLSTIDEEIARLQQVRALLAGTGTGTRGGKRSKSTPSAATKPRRTMSAAARKRIGDAQRKRWAAQRKSAKP